MEKLIMIILVGLSYVSSALSKYTRCGERLERTLDAMQTHSSGKIRHDEDELDFMYQHKLISAPLQMIITNIAVKLPDVMANREGIWARVDRCHFEPGNNSLLLRIMVNDLSVSGTVSLMPIQPRVSIFGESCRMKLRLRWAGIDFFTSPIFRSRGQMRIRTESNFLEPRFASTYAYDCRLRNRVDRHMKRQDKPHDPTPIVNIQYDEAEPRNFEFRQAPSEDEIAIRNGSSMYDIPYTKFSPMRKTFWMSTLLNMERKITSNNSVNFEGLIDNFRRRRYDNLERSYEMIGWQLKENISREVEDVFLHGASEVLTKYIEHQLHPTIRETLMISMGYTISYGK